MAHLFAPAHGFVRQQAHGLLGSRLVCPDIGATAEAVVAQAAPIFPAMIHPGIAAQDDFSSAEIAGLWGVSIISVPYLYKWEGIAALHSFTAETTAAILPDTVRPDAARRQVFMYGQSSMLSSDHPENYGGSNHPLCQFDHWKFLGSQKSMEQNHSKN